jgi:hypothetical protein
LDRSRSSCEESVTSRSAGDALVTGSQFIEVRVAELRQLFNAIDPSPFRERDLDPRAEEFIVEWARDLPRDTPLALRVHLERAAGRADEAALLREAIHQYFKMRAAGSRRGLRELFRRGRISLLIALAFLGATLTLSDLLGSASGFAAIMREGLIIGGWVAMWRPLEVFLYDWWPLVGDIRLLDRLSTMPVSIEYTQTASDDAWRSDWPAMSTGGRIATRSRTDVERAASRRIVMSSENSEHQHTPEEEHDIREAALDETIEASFPASDPPSSNPNPFDHEALRRQHNQ